MNKLYFVSLVVLSSLIGCNKIIDEDAPEPSGQVNPTVKSYLAQSEHVIYSYQGNCFNLFSCGGPYLCSTPDPAFTSYTTSNCVIAVLTLSEPLSGGLILYDVRNLPGFSLTLNDGHQTFTFDPGVPDEVFVSTDETGNIIAPWSVIANGTVPPNNGIFTLNWPGFRGIGDGGTLSAPTLSTPDTPRDQGIINSSPGVWTTDISTPEELIGDLQESVNTLIGIELKEGQANGLLKPLENALRSIDNGKISAACSQLEEFIAGVKAKTPPLSIATATALIAEALAIQTAIGC